MNDQQIAVDMKRQSYQLTRSYIYKSVDNFSSSSSSSFIVLFHVAWVGLTTERQFVVLIDLLLERLCND